jgi:hypothetical protein
LDGHKPRRFSGLLVASKRCDIIEEHGSRYADKRHHIVNESSFQELIKAGLGRGIIYARDNDVGPFRDVILDACLHCYSVDPQSEGTRAGYMLELVNLLSDRQFYFDEVLNSLPHSGDDWDAVQRFHFATYMAFDGDERAKHVAYESFDPGPRKGEAIAIDFLRMDGVKGLVFGAAKIGALLMANPDEVDEGWLWSQAVKVCGEDKASAALYEAGSGDPRVEAYRLAAAAHAQRGRSSSNEVTGLNYQDLGPRMSGLRGFRLNHWGKQASADDFESAARGLATATSSADQIQHLRIFARRQFPLDPALLLHLSSSDNAEVAYAAAVALSNIRHRSVRAEAFRLASNRLPGRERAISMLDQNWDPNDHEIVLNWFDRELDRDTRHGMQRGIKAFWEHHPEPVSEPRMLHSLYEKGTCSFCREFVVKRLIELGLLSDSLRAECAHDANDEIRELIGVSP